MSTITGLISLVRLLVPPIVKFVLSFFEPKIEKERGIIYAKKSYFSLLFLFLVREKLFQRIKNLLKKIIRYLYAKLANLNIFQLRSFGIQIDEVNAERLGCIATRFYIVLLAIGLCILALYTIIQPKILTKNYVEPSLSLYRRLIKDHPNTLECPCSKVSSPYSRSVTIEPIFHQVRRKRR